MAERYQFVTFRGCGEHTSILSQIFVEKNDKYQVYGREQFEAWQRRRDGSTV